MLEKSWEREIGIRHGGITGFEVKIGRDGGISEPGTGPSYNCMGHEVDINYSHSFTLNKNFFKTAGQQTYNHP